MLRELRVRNFAIVEDGAMTFQSGYSVFTGETGAGKSLLLDAITLLLGAKARTDLVRTGQKSAEVEGLFDLSGDLMRRQRLTDMGFETDESEGYSLVVRREISSGEASRNRIWIQGRSATRAQLQEVLGDLVEVSGQHEFLRLNRDDFILGVVDQFGRLREDVQEYQESYSLWKTTERQMKEVATQESHRESRLDYLQFQLAEFERAGVSAQTETDEGQWLALRQRLVHVEKIRKACETLGQVIDGVESSDDSSAPGARSLILRAEREFSSFQDLGGDVLAVGALCSQVLEKLDELSDQGRRLSMALDTDPEALDSAEQKLSELRKLKRKFNTETVGLIQLKNQFEEERDQLAQGTQRLDALQKKSQELRARLESLATKLHQRRVLAAGQLQKLWESDIRELGMEHARIQLNVGLSPELGTHGVTSVQAGFAGNPGEAIKPLGKVASGGELSRLMLALKSVALGGTGEVTVYLFDEVDTGIGGHTATHVGQRLQRMAQNSQVLVVTHLAQVAAFAQRHFKIEKSTKAGRTRTSITELGSGSDRRAELARMLGDVGSSAAQNLADELLVRAKTDSKKLSSDKFPAKFSVQSELS